MLLKLVEKIKHLYVLLTLVGHNFVTTSFDFWISKGAHDIFTFVINFLGIDWQPKHVTLGLFESANIDGKTLIKNLIELLQKYNLIKRLLFM
jgi:hypothetical protein